MGISSTDIGEELSFGHEALIYDDDDQFLVGVIPLISAALVADEPVLVAVSQRKSELLKGELGGDAAAIGFVAMEEVGRNPARIVPFWRDFVDGWTGGPTRGISELIWPDRSCAEIDECQRHESLLNLALAPGANWSLLCTYDAAVLPDRVLAAVSHSHRAVARDGVREVSSEYRAEPDCYRGELPRHPSDAEAFAYDRSRLSAVRQRVKRAAEEAGVAAREAADLIAAGSELAANSIAHGGGAGTLRIWQERDRLLVEFEDRGTIEEPLAGRLRPSTSQRGGRGLWLANQLCDLVQIRSSELGTTVRLQAALS